MTFFAYLDPGTGSVILQVLVGGAAALTVTARLWWQRVTSIFRRNSSQEKGKPEPEPSSGPSAP